MSKLRRCPDVAVEGARYAPDRPPEAPDDAGSLRNGGGAGSPGGEELFEDGGVFDLPVFRQQEDLGDHLRRARVVVRERQEQAAPLRRERQEIRH